MNLLEAFHFIFEADASNLKTGLQSAEKDNEKLKKGVEETDKSALKLGETFLSVAKSAAALFAGVVSVGALTAMSSEIAAQTNELADQAKALNVNASALHTWQNAVIASGGTAEGFNSTLANLNKVTRDPERQLLRMADTFKQLSSYRALKLGEQLGIDAGTAEMLRKGREGVKALLEQERERGTVTKELLEVSAKYKESMRQTNLTYDDLKRQLAVIILPLMTKWLDIIRGTIRFMQDNKVATIAFFASIAGIITAVYLPAMLRAVAATYALLAPYLLVGAAIAAVGAAIALVADDVYEFLQGNDSMIGELSKSWPWIGELVRDTAAEVLYLLDVCKSLWAFMVKMFDDPAAAWAEFKDAVMNGLNALGDRFPFLKPIIKELQDYFKAFATGVVDAFEVVKGVLNTIGRIIETITGGIGNAISKIKGWLGTASEAGAEVQDRIANTAPENESPTSGRYRAPGSQTGFNAVQEQARQQSDQYGPNYDPDAPKPAPRPAADNAEVLPQNEQANPYGGNYRAEGSQPAYDSEADQLSRNQVQRDQQPDTVAPAQPDTGDFIQQNTVNMAETGQNPAPAAQPAIINNKTDNHTVNIQRAAEERTEAAAPVVNVPQQQPPAVTVEAPAVNVQQAVFDSRPPARQAIPATIGARKEHKPDPAPQKAAPAQMTPQGQQQIAQTMVPAKQQVAQMATDPINRQNSSVIANAGRQRAVSKTDINIDNIEVNTQAQDADGIAKALEGSMQAQFANATSDFDDGMMA